jgi:hypothetical protein
MSVSPAVNLVQTRLHPTGTLVHGGARRGKMSPEYISWCKAKSRCFSPSDDNYSSYGGKGIRMCRSWRNSFVSFRNDMGRRPKGKTLDRIKNNLHYSCGHCAECKRRGWKMNCRWATFRQQLANCAKPREAHGFTSYGIIPREIGVWYKLRERAARGEIEISPSWKSYKNFIADVGKRPSPKHRIYRLLNKGAFAPGNAKWMSIPQRVEERRKARPHKPRVYVRPGYCPSGHKYTKKNTYRSASGHRYCRECHRVESRAYYDKHLRVRPERHLPLAA